MENTQKNTISLSELIKVSKDMLGNIEVPVALTGTISIPISNVMKNLNVAVLMADALVKELSSYKTVEDAKIVSDEFEVDDAAEFVDAPENTENDQNGSED